MGSLYRSQHELVAVFRKGKRPHVNNVELGRNGRHRSNVWNYAGVNSYSAERDEALAWHPTVTPLEMIVDIIKDASDRDEIVLDGFGGWLRRRATRGLGASKAFWVEAGGMPTDCATSCVTM